MQRQTQNLENEFESRNFQKLIGRRPIIENKGWKENQWKDPGRLDMTLILQMVWDVEKIERGGERREYVPFGCEGAVI